MFCRLGVVNDWHIVWDGSALGIRLVLARERLLRELPNE